MLSRAMVVGCAVLLWGTAAPGAEVPQNSGPSCTPAGSLVRLADLPEASGLAVSRTVPGRLWTHNDSGAPGTVRFRREGKAAGTRHADRGHG